MKFQHSQILMQQGHNNSFSRKIKLIFTMKIKKKNKWYICTPGFKVIPEFFNSKEAAQSNFDQRFDETREFNWKVKKGSDIIRDLEDEPSATVIWW